MSTNFIVGQVLMLLAYQDVKAQSRRLFTTPFMWTIAYAVFIFVPVAAWFFYHETGWSTVYLKPEDAISGWAGPGFFIQYVIGMFLGSLLAQNLIQQGRTYMVFVTLPLGVIWLLTTWSFTLDQYLHVGTYAQYHGGQAKSLLEDSAIQMRLNIGGGIMAVPAIGLGYWFFQRSQKISKKWFK